MGMRTLLNGMVDLGEDQAENQGVDSLAGAAHQPLLAAAETARSRASQIFLEPSRPRKKLRMGRMKRPWRIEASDMESPWA